MERAAPSHSGKKKHRERIFPPAYYNECRKEANQQIARDPATRDHYQALVDACLQRIQDKEDKRKGKTDADG